MKPLQRGLLAPHSPWQLAAGFTLWAIWFVAVYGGLSVGCAVAPPSSERGAITGLGLGLMALTAATVALLLLAAAHCLRGLRRLRAQRMAPAHGEDGAERRERRQFVAGLSALLHLGAAVATAFVGLPLLWLPPCL